MHTDQLCVVTRCLFGKCHVQASCARGSWIDGRIDLELNAWDGAEDV